MRSRKSLKLFITVVSAACLAACGGDGTECGTGTIAEDGTCVPEISDCAPGTVLQDGECVPQCGDDQYYDSDAEECLDVPECAAGTVFNTETGACEPGEDLCAPGTHLEGGVCVSDTTGCGEGTHEENGNCVPDYLPDPDVFESDDPEIPASLSLPEEGESITLGGTVDTPEDTNDDGYLEGDWDVFVVTAPAGTYLKIHATSEGATLPAFMVISTQVDEDERPLFARYSINPNGVDTVREVYLPRDDAYLIWVTDYNHMVSMLFGSPAYPVGGEEFTYFVTVENRGQPEISVIDSLPFVDEGQLENGRLYFYQLENILIKDVVELLSLGEPLADSTSDILPVVTLFDADGQPLREAMGTNPAVDARVLFSAQEDGSFLVVQDFLVRIGPDDLYALEARSEVVTDCTGGSCTDGSLDEGAHSLLRWDLTAGDFFLFSFTVPADAEENLGVEIFDQNMISMGRASAGQTWNRWARMFVTFDTWVYLWLEGWTGAAVDEYFLEYVHEPTNELVDGVDADGLAVFDMPDETMLDGGVCHFVADGDQLVIATRFNNPGWSEPFQEFHTPDFVKMGPALDVSGAEPVPLDPAMAFVPEEGMHLHLSGDALEGGDIVGDTYDTTLAFLAVAALGAPDADNPVGDIGQLLDADMSMAAFAFDAADAQPIVVTVSPGTTLQAEVWVLGFGFQSGDNWYWRADQHIMGLKASDTGASQEEDVVINMTADYAGPYIVIVRDAGSADQGETFDIEVAQGS